MDSLEFVSRRAFRVLAISPLSIMIALIVSVVLMATASERSYAQEEVAGSATLRIEAPGQVAVGEVIVVTLRLEGEVAVGGFEAQLLYGREMGEFAGFAPLLPAAEAGVGQLVVPETPTGSVVGFYTCGTEPCLRVRAAQVRAAAVPEVMAQVELLARAAGQLEVSVAHVQVVNRRGERIALDIPQSSVTVQVGEGNEIYAAPASTWAWRADNAAVGAVDATAADVTQDGRNTHGDVMEVALGWQIVREEGLPCGGSEMAADVNGDGCVDIVDVQLAAAFADGSHAAAASEATSNTPEDSGLSEQMYLPWSLDSSGAAVRVAAVMTFTVNSAQDKIDINIGDGICDAGAGACTLRAAIAEANKNPGNDMIVFAIPGGGVKTIQLGSRLPTISDEAGGIFIDGYSQPEAAPNSDALVSNAQIRVQISGNGTEVFDGMTVTSAGNVVRGLAFYNLKRSIWVYGAGAHDNAIVGNFIGTDAAGIFHATITSEQQAHGVQLEQGAQNNHIGGVLPAERNVVSGNARHGVGMWHVGTQNNVVFNNLVGLSPDGTRRVSNRLHGVDINFGASYNIVGGLQPGERNVISGNNGKGAEISHGAETMQNIIIGNYIGTDVTGTSGPHYSANGNFGVSLQDRVTNNLVTDNVIGNNLGGGVNIDTLENCCTSGNRIERNRIGVSLNGAKIGNTVFGIRIFAIQSRIGPDNIIAYNSTGIQIEGDISSGNTITRNSIFENAGLGIDIAPLSEVNLNDTDDADSGPNGLLNYPVLNSATPIEVTGTACVSCSIEVYITDEKTLNFGEGKTFVGAGVADANGIFTITLHTAVFGDYLTATATDMAGNTSEFSRNILVNNPTNGAPQAHDDSATTYAGIPVTIDVLSNDVDPEDDELSVVALGEAANGELFTNGSYVVYTPTANFQGVDSFTYSASDNLGGASVATVTVTVELSTTVTAGIKVDPTAITVSVGGPPVTYTLVLVSQPLAAVTVTVTPDEQLNVTPTQLFFDANNWNSPQVVAVSVPATEAVNIATTSDYQRIARHQVTSTDSNYNNVGAPNLVVTVTEEPEPSNIYSTLYVPMIAR